MDAMKFFQMSSGKWVSQRTTHHLAFRRSETGESEIQVETLAVDHPKVLEICQLHEVDPEQAVGGALVTWQSSMGWDREDENHEGSTVFVLVPNADNERQGLLLRERGYAEIVPVAGHYHIDDEDGLVLTTEYETMSSIERFWFAAPGVRLRTSTVKRFGGFSTATFCTEFRLPDGSDFAAKDATSEADAIAPAPQTTSTSSALISLFGW